MVLTFESVYDILNFDHSNKSFGAVLYSGFVNYAQDGFDVFVCKCSHG